MKKVICIIGESGTGKTTLANALVKADSSFTLIKSYTTRPRRKNESNSDHIFISEEEYDAIKSKKIATTVFGGYRYCCTEDQLVNNSIYIVDDGGLEALKKNLSKDEYNIISIRLYADKEILEKRGISEERMNRDKDKFYLDRDNYLGVIFYKKQGNILLNTINLPLELDMILKNILKEQLMKKYIGLKEIEAEPCSRREFIKKHNDCKSAEENVEGYEVKYEDGYTSWSPKDVFEKAYREINTMTYSIALEACRRGYKIARKGWNGKNMFIFYVPGATIKEEWCKDPILKDLANKNGGEIECEPMLRIYTAQGTISSGWRPTNLDQFADDWYIVK